MTLEKELDETEIRILPLKRKSVQSNDYKFSPKSEQMNIVRTSTKRGKNINKNQTPERYSS